MNKQQFKIWLTVNNYTQQQLADKLSVSIATIQRYISADRFPKTFVYALHGLALINLTSAQYEAVKPLLTDSQRVRINILDKD